MNFEHDTLNCHVRKVNPRCEVHGDDDVTAVDVSLRLMENDSGTAWESVLADLMQDVEEPGEIAENLSEILAQLQFNAEADEHKVNFWHGNELLATLVHAKINKFVMSFGEDAGIVFRVQAITSGQTIGKLAELMKRKVRVETVAMQQDLDFDKDDDDSADADLLANAN